MAAIRHNFKQREVIRPDDYHWVDAPVAGVQRMMLDRIGNEQARATSLVRYAPNSRFPAHEHPGGEEILVLEGQFADEHAAYPTGTYLRNPSGTRHQPEVGPEGALIFVKLQQFADADQQSVCIDTHSAHWRQGLVDGLSVLPLHEYGAEHVALVKWAPNTHFSAHRHWGGEEILVLSGVFHDEHGQYPQGSWIRSPHLSDHRPFTLGEGALIYVKTGHLPD